MVPRGQHVMGALARMRVQNEEDVRTAAAAKQAAQEAAAKAAAEVGASSIMS